MQQNEKKVRIRRVMQQELTLSKAILLSSGQRDVPAKNSFRLRMKANFQARTTTKKKEEKLMQQNDRNRTKGRAQTHTHTLTHRRGGMRMILCVQTAVNASDSMKNERTVFAELPHVQMHKMISSPSLAFYKFNCNVTNVYIIHGMHLHQFR